MPKHISEISRDTLTHLNPKIAFFDLDGTLVNSNHEIADHVVASIEKLKANGILAGISSGRAAFSAQDIIDKVGMNGPCCFFGGALVLDPVTGKSIFSEHLGKTLSKTFVDLAKEKNLLLELYTENEYFIQTNHKLHDVHSRYIGKKAIVADLDSILSEKEILKVVIVGLTENEAQIKELLDPIQGISIGFAPGMANPEMTFANITSEKASRKHAFNASIQSLGINSEETISFGDAQSDIPFLQMAGAGIAMENAPDAVKQAADYITSHVNQEGVSAFINLLT